MELRDDSPMMENQKAKQVAKEMDTKFTEGY